MLRNLETITTEPPKDTLNRFSLGAGITFLTVFAGYSIIAVDVLTKSPGNKVLETLSGEQVFWGYVVGFAAVNAVTQYLFNRVSERYHK